MPHETRLIILKPENSGNKRGPRNQVGSASINHSGPRGAVLARTLVEDSRMATHSRRSFILRRQVSRPVIRVSDCVWVPWRAKPLILLLLLAILRM
jgi:hypothetical protein